MIDLWLENGTAFWEQSRWLAPMIAFVAGIVTSFTPCCIANISLVIGYIGGTGKHQTKNAFQMSLIYACGSAAVFVLLGLLASLLGKMIHFESPWWFFLLGVLMVVLSLQMMGICHVIPHFDFAVEGHKKGYVGALATGALGGVFSSSCAIPALMILLAAALERGSILWGLLLMLLYAIGHSILTILAGTSINIIKNFGCDGRYGKWGSLANRLLGSVIFLTGIFLFYLAFHHVH